MSKRKKAVLAVGLVLAVLLIGAIIFYLLYTFYYECRTDHRDTLKAGGRKWL